nr:hypothetical protein [Sphingobium sp. Leaf26]
MAFSPGRGPLALAARGLAPAGKGLDDGHVPAAAWAWRTVVGRFVGDGFHDWRGDAEQPAGERHGVLVR